MRRERWMVWASSIGAGESGCLRDGVIMSDQNAFPANSLYIEVTGSGLPEVDGLFVPSTAPPAKSESGMLSSLGYWNGRMAWDRADGKSKRSPALSYSNTYKAWRICRLDGHLAYELTCDDELPPTDREWNVYKKGVAPAPKVELHHFDPRKPCPKPNVVFVLGGPGTGKGTMCELAEAQLGWIHLSTGELCREECERGGEKADIIEAELAKGKLAPDDIMVELLKEAMDKAMRATGKTNFLLDGFPRCMGNLDGWYEIYGKDAELPRMLFFDCPFEVLEQRILGRAKFTGRKDDNVEYIKLRYDTFREETIPTVEFFREKGLCVDIDTSRGRKDVYDDVVKNLLADTDPALAANPLTEKSEMLLGLRPFPKREKA